MFIRPAAIPEGMEGAGARYRVRDPITHEFLSEEGENKPASDYWLRRLLDGGVEVTGEPEILKHPDVAQTGDQIQKSEGTKAIAPVPEAKPEGDAP